MPISFSPAPQDPEFDQFWKQYPRKVKKGDARKAWFQTKELRPPVSKILKALIVQSASDNWLKDGGSYIPYPATWLRAEQWDDSTEIELAQVTRDGNMWWESVSGVEKKAAELGLEWNARGGESWQAFTQRVRNLAMGNVVELKNVAGDK